MTDSIDGGARPGWTPPIGTSQRIRNRAVWAVALFMASVPPAIVGLGIAAASEEQVNIAMPFALFFWALGVVFALWAAFPTLRYWEGLAPHTRWLGVLPLLTVLMFFTGALIAPLLA